VILEKDEKTVEEDPHAEYALVSKQRFNAHHEYSGTTLTISPQLLSALKAVVKYYQANVWILRRSSHVTTLYDACSLQAGTDRVSREN
jgi:hypothetical protein